MSSYQKTLWMGNIETWMNYAFLSSLLGKSNIHPKKIIIKNPSNKRGCAFLEFTSHEQAEYVLNNFNGKSLHGLELKFNWVRSIEEKYSSPKVVKFTVRHIYKFKYYY